MAAEKKKNKAVCEHDWNNGDIPEDLLWCQFNNAATVKENWRTEGMKRSVQLDKSPHNEC